MKTFLLAAALLLGAASAQIKLPAGVSPIEFASAEVTFTGKVTKTLSLEAAITPEQSERGLMYRTSMPKDAGMLFLLGVQDRRVAFWMKNTLIPLDIAYFNSQGTIVDILQMKPCKATEANCPTYPSSKPVVGAIEMNLGWFKKNSIKAGDKVTFKMKY
ncbi:DUF192 domain-containing protein [Deinococcus cellulosilyticus]|uniref:DUF192 domain-containing protein n=1 Tax=Deinococcus cellulosilyticus (strain DSM 18568 / NBRC 106333 / KACC 11606 / 5516J-15) TaxID=1223518 RepID=A0A511MXY6_DEIC1|nr:DUF192 domain-containing protein [Deinococcus cellulosilyticus]GEM45444.1 hypothetical protein DC3_10790 [Deinococcus cellulosilyticus NBRC 106333 = KACC 11606]